MSALPRFADIGFEAVGAVAQIELRRPPANFFDLNIVRQIAEAVEFVDGSKTLRAIVLAAEGKAFCAGANLSDNPDTGRVTEAQPGEKYLYQEAVRIFRCRTPVVAAIEGSAIGGGLGLAISADFRVSCKSARFSANFARLGLHQGFGITVTLPRLVGAQQAALMLLTGRRIDGEEAVRIGLADILVEVGDVRKTAHALAAEIASSAPLAVDSIRASLRRGLADAVEAATERELVEQERLRRTKDFLEGVAASSERREPVFRGQ